MIDGEFNDILKPLRGDTVEKYINEYIRPRLQGDGGEITYVGRDGGEVTVLLQGECSKCLILNRCLAWIEERIEHDLGEKVRVVGIRKKPYFQDKGGELMAHIKVERRSMRPQEWIDLRFGWLKRHIYSEKYEIPSFTVREARQVSEMHFEF